MPVPARTNGGPEKAHGRRKAQGREQRARQEEGARVRVREHGAAAEHVVGPYGQEAATAGGVDRLLHGEAVRDEVPPTKLRCVKSRSARTATTRSAKIAAGRARSSQGALPVDGFQCTEV
jgi:hypothetical protein